MVAVERVFFRHDLESQLLNRALEGDAQAANRVFQYLSSEDPKDRQAMQETMHDLADNNLCSHLLSCLALQRWGDHRDCELRADAEASERIDAAIVTMLTQDEYEWETAIKEGVLREAFNSPEPHLRQAAAFILGLRGAVDVIPVLEAALLEGKSIEKLRAIQALDALNDARCAAPLIKAISMDRDIYHSSAVKALHNLGEKADAAWQQALHHPDHRIRWHAAQSLGEIGDTRAAGILAEGIFDDQSAVRWASVEILTRLGSNVIPAILAALGEKVRLGLSRQALFQVLKGASFSSVKDQARLKPLLECLHMPDGCAEAPAIARRLLQEWEKSADD
jgi:HEAT repeat protein